MYVEREVLNDLNLEWSLDIFQSGAQQKDLETQSGELNAYNVMVKATMATLNGSFRVLSEKQTAVRKL